MEALIPWTPDQQAKLETFNQAIRENQQGAKLWAKAFFALYESKLWRSQAESFTKYCNQQFGYNERRIKYLIEAAQRIASRELIEQTTGEPIEKPKRINRRNPALSGPESISAIQVVGPSDAKQELVKNVSSQPVSEKPKEHLDSEIPMNFTAFADSVWRTLDWLTHHVDLPVEALRKVQSVLTHADKFRKSNVLPGLETASSAPTKRRPTLDEVKLYAAKNGIIESDAVGFFYHMEGNGWTNRGRPMSSWGSTLVSWKLKGILNSQQQQQKGQSYGNQRTNGTGDNRSLLAKEMDRTSAAIAREFGNPRRISDC